jgi:carbonic anhydrase
MKALLHPEVAERLPAVKTWMVQAETTRRIIHENFSHLMGEYLLVTTIQGNVRVQLDHLRTHPAVAARVRRSALTLHGWVYSILMGEIWAFDDQREIFVSLADSMS